MGETALKNGEMLGSYQVLGPIARGGMATVFRVLDTRNNEELALKLLHPVEKDSDSTHRFRLEFRALSKLNHTNVLDVREWGMYTNRPWYTMPLLLGADLKEQLLQWDNLPLPERFERAMDATIQITRALAYIHERGFIHRDITPSNIRVCENGHIVLMDFGVVKQLGRTEQTQMGEIIGTFAYMSPEQISGEPVDARADLYSLGVLIYQMYSGKRPFNARALNGYLNHHLNTTPRPLHELQPLVPLQVSRVVTRLLQKHPRDRFASATHLLHALGAPPEVDTRKKWPPTALVGRTATRVQVQETLDSIQTNEVGKAFVFGAAAGYGKSMMLTAIQRQCRKQGLTVGRVRPSRNDTPFAPLFQYYKQVKVDVGESRDIESWITANEKSPQEHYTLHAAYRDWLLAAGPMVILLDDIFMADGATLELIEYLIRNTHEINQAPILFAFTEDIDDQFRPTEEMNVNIIRHTLGPLDPNDVEELIFSFLGESDAARVLATRLHSECNGAPSFVSDMLHGLFDENVIHHDTDGFLALKLSAQDLLEVLLPLPKSVKSAITERIEQLSADATVVGALVALAPRGLDITTVISLVSLDEGAVMSALDALEDAQIVTENHAKNPPTIELAHERFRSVLGNHTESSLEVTHAKLGEALEQQQRYSLENVSGTLAHHFSMAKIPTKAFFYQLTSGRRLVKNSLYKRGVTSLNRALSLEPEARPLMPLADVDRLTIKLQLSRAEALSAIGEIEDSTAAAHTALDLADRLQDLPLLSRCHALIGHQYQSRSELERAEHHLKKALVLANKIGHDKLRVMPTYRLGSIKWSQGEIESPKKLWGEALSLAQKIGDERAIGYGVNGLGLVAICEGRAIEARRYIEQSTEIFERLGMLGPLSTTRVNLVELNMSIGILKKALDIADMTVSTAREVGHISGAGIGLAYRSEVLLAIGRITEAQSNCTEAISIAQSVSNREDFVKATIASLEINLTMGKPEKTKTTYLENKDAISSYKGEGLDDRALVYYAHSLALTNEISLANSILNDTRNTAPSWPHVQIRNQIARGKARLALGQPERAIANFQYALTEATTCQFRYWQMVAHHHLYACVEEPTMKKKHRHVLTALVRSLAAGLSKETSAQFMERWDKH